MPYVTSVERVGIRRGAVRSSREAVIQVLETRFGEVPAALISAINAMDDQARLKRALKEAVLTQSPEAFQRLLETDRPQRPRLPSKTS
jgi:hypothetical protein